MLACDKHGLDCDYLNAIWRYENTTPGKRGSCWTRKQRDCLPIFEADTSPLIVDPRTGEIPRPPGIYFTHCGHRATPGARQRAFTDAETGDDQ